MDKKSNESFARWQGRSIEQMGFFNNLLIGLSIGLVAFQINLTFSRDAILSIVEKWFFVISLVFGFLSLAFGVSLALNRLSSFRKTAQIARKRETGKREGIDELRKHVKELDNRTWKLLKSQIVTLGLEILSLATLAIMRLILLQ